MSYFAAAGAGVVLAVITALVVSAPHRQATAGGVVRKLGRVLRRVLPAWLVLAAMLGFMSVTYIDCGHPDYAKVVADRPHLIAKTQEQVSAISLYLAIALTAYAFVFVLFLWARKKSIQARSGRP